MIPLVIGVDVGVEGALAALRGPEFLYLGDLPTTTVERGRSRRREYLVPELAEMVRSLLAGVPAGTEIMAYVERQRPMPRQGVASMFSLGCGFGIVRGVLGALDVPVAFVEPTAWKQAVGLPRGAEKGASIELASRLYPVCTSCRFKDGRAEALLIARYGYLQLRGASEAA